MFDGGDFGGAERLVDDWQAGLERRAAAARELSQRLSLLSGSARSPDGHIAVTVGSSGVVRALTLDEAVRRRPAAETAGAILATVAAAQAALVAQARIAADETVGAGSEMGRAVIASYAGSHADGD
jgi:hypothetical protein